MSYAGRMVVAGEEPTSTIPVKGSADGRVTSEVLRGLGVARQLVAGAASASTALTATCRNVSVRAVGADIRYAVGVGAQVASATTHFIGDGERLDLLVPAGAHIAVLRAGSTDGVLEVSELI